MANDKGFALLCMRVSHPYEPIPGSVPAPCHVCTRKVWIAPSAQWSILEAAIQCAEHATPEEISKAVRMPGTEAEWVRLLKQRGVMD